MADLDIQAAAVAHLGPETGMQRIFALHGVVADQLDAQPIEFGDQSRRDVHHPGLGRAGGFLGQGNAGRDLVVDQHIELGQLRQQRRGIGVVQRHLGGADDLVGADVEADPVAAVDAAQVEGIDRAELLEAVVVAGAGHRYRGGSLGQGKGGRAGQGDKQERGEAERHGHGRSRGAVEGGVLRQERLLTRQRLRLRSATPRRPIRLTSRSEPSRESGR